MQYIVGGSTHAHDIRSPGVPAVRRGVRCAALRYSVPVVRGALRVCRVSTFALAFTFPLVY